MKNWLFSILLLFATPLVAEDAMLVPIQTCGDLDTENQANWCPRPTGEGDFVQGKSECRRTSDTSVEYTHCSGAPVTEYTGDDQCCIESTTCAGAFYAAICVNKRAGD
ncbi:hypothetical protein [Leisingera sp. JC1]|uniref:hypothetical protein n=1 Tax=Leisingera sp. JC1 TaxID=1855282 RepID=UPI001130F4C2|nr:hypothetical protein [Leisingera sp. JC1]